MLLKSDCSTPQIKKYIFSLDEVVQHSLFFVSQPQLFIESTSCKTLHLTHTEDGLNPGKGCVTGRRHWKKNIPVCKHVILYIQNTHTKAEKTHLC